MNAFGQLINSQQKESNESLQGKLVYRNCMTGNFLVSQEESP
jgi:hypothetical protein